MGIGFDISDRVNIEGNLSGGRCRKHGSGENSKYLAISLQKKETSLFLGYTIRAQTLFFPIINFILANGETAQPLNISNK